MTKPCAIPSFGKKRLKQNLVIAGGVVQRSINGSPIADPKSVGTDFAIGAVGGAAAKGTEQVLTTSIGAQAATKVGSTVNISAQTLKTVTVGTVRAVGKTVGGAIAGIIAGGQQQSSGTPTPSNVLTPSTSPTQAVREM